MVNKKVILPHITDVSYGGGIDIKWGNRNVDMIEDLTKALCYVMGEDYNEKPTLYNLMNNSYITDEDYYMNHESNKKKHAWYYDDMVKKVPAPKRTREQYIEDQLRYDSKNRRDKVVHEFGKWMDWGFFEIKGFKKGTMHFKFKDMKVWERFNRAVAEAKGFPLPESI